MANENEILTPQVEDNTSDYIATINELKSTTVARSEYEKLKRENRQLLDSLVNGTNPEMAQPVQKKSIKELRDDLVRGELNNLNYVSTALELRDAMIEQGMGDPFLPQGKQIAATSDDIKAANRVAEALKDCVEYANGDSQLFTNELQRITRDVIPAGRRR